MCKRIVFVQIFLLLLIPHFLFSQIGKAPRISIFPLENKENDLQIDVISHNIQTTVDLNLRMINKYNIVKNNIADYSSDTTWLLNYCENNNIDDLIFGNALVQPDGSIIIEMSAFNRQKAATTIIKSETAATVLDIFNTADIIAVEIIHSFSGMHLSFGEIKFINSGDKGNYSVYIDNNFVGDNIDHLPKVLLGTWHIIIKQSRMFGDIQLYDKFINVLEDKTTEIAFSIPGFLEKESSSIAKEEIYIEKNWDNRYLSKKIENSFNVLFKLLKTVEYSQTAINKKKEVEVKFAQWSEKKEELGINQLLTMLDKPLGLTFYGAAGMMFPQYKEDGPGDWQPENTFIPKAGIAFSVNIFPYLGLRTELSLVRITVNVEETLSLDHKTFEFDIAEMPLFLLIKLPPSRVLSLYGGGVLQLNITEFNSNNTVLPIKTIVPAVAG